ncbi:phage major capsid protein [Allopontixanthobacter sp.]|uniref:phage major capsid protein n=1 Tax=Allopontixanthobacter sp. TaxID=2906452 RepID=UPI002AB90B67|nr:phage major capsid protein [Allopontixanthobacter sp.]MDZ4307172.1 phage major capsid protein [Allopontixanthobacter sp.]
MKTYSVCVVMLALALTAALFLAVGASPAFAGDGGSMMLAATGLSTFAAAGGGRMIMSAAERRSGRFLRGPGHTASTHTKTAAELAKETADVFNSLKCRLEDVEQKAARGGSGGRAEPSWGQQVADSDEVKAMSAIKTSQPARARIEVKSITSGTASAGAMAEAMRDPTVNALPGRLPRIRDLLNGINTNSGSVEYVDQTARTNNAAPVAEAALKPESDYTWELANLPMRTIAHWTKASVQVLDDAPQLSSIIDGELRYGLALAEDVQLLNGSGVGVNLNGLITNSTAYAAEFAPAGENMIDKIGLAILQVGLAEFLANGIVIHPTDWMRMRMLKDADGKYILGDPQAPVPPSLFGLPVVPTTAMTVDKFLVGDFMRAATLYDRQAPTVALSTEDGDNFVKNMVTIRCESRLGLAIKQPLALSYGDFGNVA